MISHSAFVYKHRNGFLHRLNAAVKILFLIAIIAVNAFIHNYYYFAVILSVLILFYFQSGFDFRDYIKDIKFVLYLYCFGSLLWLIYQYTSILYLTEIFLKMLIFFTAFALFFRTTNLQKLFFNLRGYLPFKFILICAISIRFIPIFAAELNNIIVLQKKRGVKFTFKTLITGKAALSIIIPLIIRTLKIAEELTMYAAVKKFGYSKNRTYLYDYKEEFVKKC